MKQKNVIVGLTLLLISTALCYNCDRTPKKADKPKENVDKYVIEVSGNPDSYSPGQTYTITLKSSPSNPVTSSFVEFMIVVEPESPLEALQNVFPGNLAILDHSISLFTSRCPNAVVHTNNIAKSKVDIAWTAPPSGNGCIAIRATVYESSDSWYTDDGGLTKILCEEEENKDAQPPVFEKCCACTEAKYEIAFQGLWTRNTHPKDYPPNMWTTKLGEIIGSSHKHSKSFWNYFGTASDGLKALAEEGNTELLEDELKEMVKNDDIRTIIKARELSYPNITGTSYTVFRVDQDHHLISLVSKITPSPDWIVGVANFELCTSNCSWIQSRTFNLYPWDIGTDDGTSYNSADAPSTSPQDVKPITSDMKNYPFYNEEDEPIKPIAQLIITRQKLYEKVCEEQEDDDPCKLTEWSKWSSCSETCGNQVMTKDRQLVNPDNEVECTKDGPLELQTTIKCDVATSCEPSQCATAIWGDWSACNVTCGIGYKVRYGNHSEEVNEEDNKRSGENEEETPPCEETVECYMPNSCEEEVHETTENEDTMTGESQVKVQYYPSYSPVIDCEVSEWSEWGPCSATEPCTKGRQYRERHIITHPRNGGKSCPKLRDPKRCRVPCARERQHNSHVVDCQMGPWSKWSPCSSNCGSSAVQKRTRMIEVYPRNGGKRCGPRVDERKCSLPYACTDRESSNLNTYYK